MTHSYTPILQAQIVTAMNAVGEALLGGSWSPVLESPVPTEEIDAMLNKYIPAAAGIAPPTSPLELQSCQHRMIANSTACCTVCGEQMVAYKVTTKTVLSAPNINPCTNPEHLAEIASGLPVNCDAVYVSGPPRQVVVGYEIDYECERCSHDSFSIVPDEVFVPDCGHSHRGDLIKQQFSNVLPAGDSQ